MGITTRISRGSGGILAAVIILMIMAAAGLLVFRHWHHTVPVQTNSNTMYNYNTPPVPGTENIRAQPLFDSQLVHRLSSGPSVSPAAITPTTIKNAYSVPSSPAGAGTIAIIDAYDDTFAEQDLGTFSSYYSLRSCNSANGCFEKYKMIPGLSTDSGWALETSLDVQWAHAIAPNARILLVEAKSDLISDLMNAVDYARSRPDVVAVSMSWGANEFVGETGYDSRLTSIHSVAFFAASGDAGHGVWWPAASPNVIGVGGTTLTLTGGGAFSSETAWSGSGGGVSAYETEPSYQSGYGISGSGGYRGVPDLSYAADPNVDGMPIYDSIPNGGYSGWWTIGGTSAGTPQLAALQATSRRITLSRLYTAAAGPGYSSYFRDITSGNNGGCGSLCNAGSGYDYVTGLGSPLTGRF